MPVSSIEQTLEALKRGEIIILVDDEDRENEGDLCMLADKVTPEAINFMARFGRGLICLTMPDDRLRELDIPMMVSRNRSRLGTAFTVSIEARTGVTTGISAADRARTIRVAVDPATTPADIVSPGHIFPLAARPGGVLVRTGQTEGSVDLARLAGSTPAAIICEIMNDDGTMARMPDLEVFAATHNLQLATIADLIQYRLARDNMVERVAHNPFPTRHHPDFQIHIFRNLVDNTEHCALTLGDLSGDDPVLVRVQSALTIADVFGAQSVDDGDQLQAALQQISSLGRGVLLYISRPDRTLSWQVNDLLGRNALEPTLHPDIAKNTPPSELRNFGVGAQILRALGLSRIRLLTNNPRKIVGLEAYGIEITERLPILVSENRDNRDYLRVKRDQEGHLS
jgi:3,4-dihydroxy 2-butanone 4-phosphate synthase/GTP cyclohydrolase II